MFMKASTACKSFVLQQIGPTLLCFAGDICPFQFRRSAVSPIGFEVNAVDGVLSTTALNVSGSTIEKTLQKIPYASFPIFSP